MTTTSHCMLATMMASSCTRKTATVLALLVFLFATIFLSKKHLGRSTDFYLRSSRRLFSNHGVRQGLLLEHRQLHTDFPIKVTINLELYYITEEIAGWMDPRDAIAGWMDPRDAMNNVTLHFCTAVSEQAGGKQVNMALQGTGTVIDTHGGDNESEEIDGCTITRTNRMYDSEGEDIFGDGYNVVLQVKVIQTVYISSEVFLTEEEVTALVLLGFSRGSGGRIAFISLLQDHSAFGSVIDVEVLEELDWTSDELTLLPTLSPTVQRTAEPTLRLTSNPSLSTAEPTQQPISSTSVVTISPSPVATLSPTLSPSIAPPLILSNVPSRKRTTTVPSSLPSVEPSISPTKRIQAPGNATSVDVGTPGKNAVIIVAIVGGFATIAASCFFIICVYLPFCSKNQGSAGEANGNIGHTLGRVDRGMTGSGVLQYDSAETESLANTTLGDTHPSETKRGVNLFKRTGIEHDENGLYDSFDENSVYTSGSVLESAVNLALDTLFADTAKTSAVLKSSTQVRSTSLSPTLELNGGNDELADSHAESDTFFDDEYSVLLGTGISTAEFAPPIENPEDGSRILVETVDECSSDEFDPKPLSSSSSGEGFDGVAFVTYKDEQQQALLGTKGYDPFDDDQTTGSGRSSAFDFSEVNTVDEDMDVSICLSVSQFSEECSQPSANSLVTTKAHNTSFQDRLIDLTEEEKREIDGVQDEAMELGDDYSKLLLFSTSYDYDMESTGDFDRGIHSHAPSNSNLLRSILEDANRLSQRSKVSPDLQSPQAVSYRHDERKSSKNLARHLTQAHEETTRRYLSRSVSPVRRQPSPPSIKIQSSRGVSSSPTRPFRGRAMPNLVPELSVAHRARVIEDGILQQSKRSVPVMIPGVATLPKANRVLLGESRNKAAKEDSKEYTVSMFKTIVEVGATGSKESTRSPGVLSPDHRYPGINNPWLFDAIEQTLGPRSPAADMDSISGRSERSTRSNKSHRSQQSFDSSSSGRPPLRGGDRKLGNYHSPSCRSRPKRLPAGIGSVEIVRESLDSQSLTDDGDLLPRSLDIQLQQLESNGEGSADDQAAQRALAGSTTMSRRLIENTVEADHSPAQNHLEVLVPPGKLGVVLADRHDGRGIVVSEIRAQSTISGMLLPGDRLIEIDGQDVSHMLVPQVTALMLSKIHLERRLTVVSSTSVLPDAQEAKIEYGYTM